MAKFTRLVRFIAKEDGKLHLGNVSLQNGVSDVLNATHAYEIQGDIFGNHTVTDKRLSIKKLLCPLDINVAGTVRGLGLNYEKHAIETKMPIPQRPVLFYKPATSLSGPVDDIVIPRHLEDPNENDYECELVVIIGKEAKNVKKENALQYVLGYATGNGMVLIECVGTKQQDVSNRHWQFKQGGGQWSHGKSPDGWAPIGPAIVAASEIPDPGKLQLSTKINGTTLQDSNTADMIFGVAETIAFLSQGVTLMPGSVIMTGTPQGIGGSRTPPRWLQHGDEVTVEIEKIGSIRNKVVFESRLSKPRL